MQAIILAAGMGRRLKELTQDNTKCMVKVNGVTLIDRMLHQIERCDLSQIVIVVGYEGEKLKDYIATLSINTPIIFVDNPIYDKTNNIYSLALAKNFLCEDDTILFESDIIFEDEALKMLIEDKRETLAMVDKYESWMDGTCVKLAEDDSIDAFIPKRLFDYSETDKYYKTVNIYKFSKNFSNKYYVPFLEAYQKALGENEYYEQVLSVITMLEEPVLKGMRLSGQKWYEIDDVQDLNIAESMFYETEEERYAALAKRYGGYWRYPGMLDFCYLVNPYYPPKRMVNELKASFEVLLTQYPSGMYVNSLIAAKNFSVRQDNIVVGNGAAELIKSLMENLSGKVGIVRPTFEEYPNRYNKEEEVVYEVSGPTYQYNADDLIGFFKDKEISNFILINPDNPTGNYLNSADVNKLIKFTKENNINFVVDESFLDFSDEENASLIRQDILNENKHLYVMKSISKSYGVPGLRLGVLASGNTDVIARMKKDVAIWNINSFAEFYLQIAEKYEKDYVKALKLFKEERARFYKELSKLEAIRVLPSQANYFMIEIVSKKSSKELCADILDKYNILIKDLSSKLKDGQYIRIAIRNTKENDMLLEALRQEL